MLPDRYNVIARAVLSHAAMNFQRRPCTSAFLSVISYRNISFIYLILIRLIVDIGSLRMYGAVIDISEDQTYVEKRSALIQPIHRSHLHPQKLLHIEFETNPLDTNVDYRIQAISQSLEFIYDTV